MTGRVLELDALISKDEIGCQIADYWVTWNGLRQPWLQRVEEIRKYVYATDTRQTSNSKLPWKNSTTIPKMCQIRDNLYANYMATLFPKRRWYEWEAGDRNSNTPDKRKAILDWMRYTTSQDRFKLEAGKLVQDYIDYGNCFATVEWIDERQTTSQPPMKVGYVGPCIRRISPLDIVMNPTAPTFIEAPKIVKSLVSIGEVKKILESQSNDENRQAYEDLYNYLIEIRGKARDTGVAEIKAVEAYFQMDGFGSFRQYLQSNMVEILTFYGDLFNWETKEYMQNVKIMVVDRHKVISQGPNPSYFGFPPIFHVGWRPRQDNLWAMGPLENLVGMQYRIDHIENLKADAFDLLIFPPLKVTGYVQDFKWGPMEKIFVGDEGNVEIIAPPFQILQANVEIQNYMTIMEEMAGSPREAMGIRSPGEKTAFEVQRLENAWSRLYASKTAQFEEQGVERWLNAMLELSRRNLSGVQEVSVFDDELKFQAFVSLTPADLVGTGTVRPIAARNFAEKAEMIQNLTQLYATGVAQDQAVMVHFSGWEFARMLEYGLNLEQYKIVQQNVRIVEQADTQRLANTTQEQVQMEAQTPSGLAPDDHSASVDAVPTVDPRTMM